MIDLKRPLDGVPGLLLMAALILFGMTVGVAIALVASWIELKDSVANFLGGIVGAGLGAALAILGAVYVQRRDRRDRIEAPINLLSRRATELRDHLLHLASILVPSPDSPLFDDSSELRGKIVCNQIPYAQTLVDALPDGAQLSAAIHAKALEAKRHTTTVLELMKSHLEIDWTNRPQSTRPRIVDDAYVANVFKNCAAEVTDLISAIDKLR